VARRHPGRDGQKTIAAPPDTARNDKLTSVAKVASATASGNGTPSATST
jgi:hypothetical protein